MLASKVVAALLIVLYNRYTDIGQLKICCVLIIIIFLLPDTLFKPTKICINEWDNQDENILLE